jgi:hypothetical protein
MTTKQIIIILTIAALIGALIWLMVDKTWEPLVTTIGLIAALIAEIYGDKGNGNNGGNVKMTQKGGKNSTNYQSGGDMNINR